MNKIARISSRIDIAKYILEQRGDDLDPQLDAMLYLIADNLSVSVHWSNDHGGMVVEIAE